VDKLVAFTKDPVLAVWQAMSVLDKLRAQVDTPDLSEILTQAETALFSLVKALARHAKNAGPISSEVRLYQPHGHDGIL
jgi:hypothetical protein